VCGAGIKKDAGR